MRRCLISPYYNAYILTPPLVISAWANSSRSSKSNISHLLLTNWSSFQLERKKSSVTSLALVRAALHIASCASRDQPHNLALKTVVTEIPSEGTLAETACNKLVPQLLKQLQNVRTSPLSSTSRTSDSPPQTSTPPETIIETLNTLSVLVTRFPQLTIRAANDPVSVFVPLLDHSRPAVRKRTIITLGGGYAVTLERSKLMHYFPQLNSFLLYLRTDSTP